MYFEQDEELAIFFVGNLHIQAWEGGMPHKFEDMSLNPLEEYQEYIILALL